MDIEWIHSYCCSVHHLCRGLLRPSAIVLCHTAQSCLSRRIVWTRVMLHKRLHVPCRTNRSANNFADGESYTNDRAERSTHYTAICLLEFQTDIGSHKISYHCAIYIATDGCAYGCAYEPGSSHSVAASICRV